MQRFFLKRLFFCPSFVAIWKENDNNQKTCKKSDLVSQRLQAIVWHTLNIMQKMTTFWITWDARNSGEKNRIPLSVIRTLRRRKREIQLFRHSDFLCLNRADPFKESFGDRTEINLRAAVFLTEEGRVSLTPLTDFKNVLSFFNHGHYWRIWLKF